MIWPIVALPEFCRLERIGFRWNVLAQNRREAAGRQSALQKRSRGLSHLFVMDWLVRARSQMGEAWGDAGQTVQMRVR